MACLSSGGGKPTYNVLSKRPGRSTAGSMISEEEQIKLSGNAGKGKNVCIKLAHFTWSVCGSHDENLATRFQPIHLGQQLVHHTHAGSSLTTRQNTYNHILLLIFAHSNKGARNHQPHR